MLSNELIQELISCEKTAVSSDRKNLQFLKGHWTNNVYLVSESGLYKYKMLIRQSEAFIENFSIGLIWTNPNKIIESEKPITLFRCNGNHDGNKPLDSDIHHSYHTHEITLEDFSEKRFSEPSKKETTKEYSNFQQALLYFIHKCDILNIED